MVNNRMFISKLSNTRNKLTATSQKLKGNISFECEDLIEYRSYIKKAKHFFQKGELMEAYHNYSIAKKIAVDILWYEAEAHCLMAIGTINTIWKKFDIAYKNYMNCLNVILDKELNDSLSLVYFRLSDFYKKTNNHKLSKSYSEKAINSIRKTTILG